ncbi:hypothetical protein HU175_18185 [Spirosoma sp. KUDC1026]|nr:hypothetical protein HU175_18185 [Spirosoma sp. KUDC1026]
MLAVLPVVCFSLLILNYTVNIPWMDDIDAFLSFLLGYTDAGSVGEKIDWLLRPNNEHRILTAKLITLSIYAITGTINFKALIISAFLFLLGLLFLFYRLFRAINLPLLAFVPVPFLLLQPQHYLVSMWAITGLQHEVVLFLAFTSLYLLATGQRKAFSGALAIQLLASLSMSNGLFCWVAGAVVLAVQRNWTRLALWLALGAAAIIFYFHDFQSPQGNESSFSFFQKYPYIVLAGFFTFTGALFDFFPDAPIFQRSILPTIWGLVLVPTMLLLLWQMNAPLFLRSFAQKPNRSVTPLQQRRYFFTGAYAFLMVNALVVAFLRPRFGYEVMLVSNYMLYPAILTILIYLNLLSEYSTSPSVQRWVTLGLVLSLSVWGVWYVLRFPKVAHREQMLLTQSFNQQRNGVGLGASWGSPFATLAANALNETVRRGMYQYPASHNLPYDQLSSAGTTDSVLGLQIQEGDYSTVVHTTSPLPAFRNPSAVVVQSATHSYLFVSEAPYALRTFWLRRPVASVQGEILNGMLAPGTYRTGILLPETISPALRFSARQVTIP